MTGKQRGLAALRGRPQDLPAVIPIVGQAAARLCGVSISEHAHDPSVLARCQIECARRFGYDGIYIAADTWVNAEAIGFPWIEHPADAPAGGRGTWIRSATDIKRLPMPEPDRSGRWPVMLEAVRQAVRQAGDDLLVIANFDQSPFSLACQLRGIAQFMTDLIERPALARDLLAYCAEAVSRYAIALSKAGAHVLNTGDSAACGGLIGRERYQQFAWPYERHVFEAIRRASSVPLTLHICGDTRSCLDLMVDSGADGIEIDACVEMSAARAAARECVTIIGNVDPVGVLVRGTPAEVRARCSACLEAFAGSTRFILSSGCALSPLTPPENIAAMVEAARSAG